MATEVSSESLYRMGPAYCQPPQLAVSTSQPPASRAAAVWFAAMRDGFVQHKSNEGGHQLMKKQLLLLGIVFVSSVWLLFHLDVSNLGPPLLHHRHIPEDRRQSGFLVNTEGCRIQDLDPFDIKIREFISEDKPPACSTYKYGRIVKADTDSVYIDWNILENASISYNLKDVTCKYCEFWRIEFPYNRTASGSYPRTVDTLSRFSSDCQIIENRTFITNEEFVQVECFSKEKIIFSDYFTFPKNDNKNMKLRKASEVNVLLIGVDAVSRLNLHRQMPKTVHFLKHKLSSIEMLGYNKIGDNTFPNLVAVLSGLTIEELTKNCWPHTDSVFDSCPLIWRKYKNAGFHTAYAEDSAQIGLFNYLKVGFRKQPTDYYGQIFNLVAESKIGHDKRLNTHLCVGNRMSVDLLLDEARNFALRLKDILTWGIFWSTSLSHDYLNLPRYGDQTYLEFMEKLLSEGVFNSTVVIFLSDHGIRWGGIRETYQGYIEERLPFLFISYPEWLERKYPLAIRNMRTNRRRLTTPFDLYETLLDLIDLRNIEDSMVKLRVKSLKKPRGISLFLPIPESRTCGDASITKNWCTCHTSKPLSTNDSVVQQISTTLVDHINSLLLGYKECSKLLLQKIHSARMDEVAIGEEENAHKDKLTDYYIVVETAPGNALFEATIRYSSSGSNKSRAVIIDPVSRLNTYGDQSKCMTYYAFKLYCFCIV